MITFIWAKRQRVSRFDAAVFQAIAQTTLSFSLSLSYNARCERRHVFFTFSSALLRFHGEKFTVVGLFLERVRISNRIRPTTTTSKVLTVTVVSGSGRLLRCVREGLMTGIMFYGIYLVEPLVRRKTATMWTKNTEEHKTLPRRTLPPRIHIIINRKVLRHIFGMNSKACVSCV